MKTTLILLAALFGVAYAGVGVLSPGEEAHAIQMFEKLCNGGEYGGGGEGGANLGGVILYCKRANGDQQQTLTHQVHVNTGGTGQNQVVYVQPPPVHYKHKVWVQKSGSQGGQTKIYVLPQKASHDLSANYQGGQVTAQKPTVYFLNGGGSSSSASYGPPANRQPESAYGTPPQHGYSD